MEFGGRSLTASPILLVPQEARRLESRPSPNEVFWRGTTQPIAVSTTTLPRAKIPIIAQTAAILLAGAAVMGILAFYSVAILSFRFGLWSLGPDLDNAGTGSDG